MNILGLYAAVYLVVVIMIVLFIALAVVGVIAFLADNKKLSKRCGSTMLAMIIFVLVYLFLSYSPEPKRKSTNDKEQYTVSITNDNVTISKSEEKPKELTTRVIEKTTNTIGNWEITTNTYAYFSRVDDELFIDYYPKNENAYYFIIDMSVKNLGKEKDEFLPYPDNSKNTSALLVVDGYKYEPTPLYYTNRPDLNNCEINPHIKTDGYLAFEIPSEIVFNEEAITLVVSCGSENVNFILR